MGLGDWKDSTSQVLTDVGQRPAVVIGRLLLPHKSSKVVAEGSKKEPLLGTVLCKPIPIARRLLNPSTETVNRPVWHTSQTGSEGSEGNARLSQDPEPVLQTKLRRQVDALQRDPCPPTRDRLYNLFRTLPNTTQPVNPQVRPDTFTWRWHIVQQSLGVLAVVTAMSGPEYVVFTRTTGQVATTPAARVGGGWV